VTGSYPFVAEPDAGVDWVSRIDARVRILVGLVVVIAIAVTLDPVAYALLTLTLAVGWIALRLTLADLRKVAAIWLTMAAITLLLHLIFNRSGHIPLITVLGLTVTREAMIAGLQVCWRLGLFLLAAFCLTRMLTPDDLARGIWGTLAPLKKLGLRTDGVGMALWIAIRFIPAIFTQYQQIVFAQQARGATYSGGMVARVAKLAPILVPVTAAALRKSDLLADALTVRGWGACESRTSYHRRRLGTIDYLAIVATAIWGFAVIGVGW
jgi:energy-coupling factor transporter transmembrane protein EcfT